ncbi:MAG TPA: (2Fe-2S) ferredoxin domain-containing protein [Anaerolineaceae bacterium]|jgi:NADP-reducing hydrogenase subunit HndB|nr:(2Fe-2S) ferredoxin domain-containing protein [Anaerolineaceae bacterium]HPS32181.1 (2Fe-2S) ferredoxin domain-containing protein [Anaerolineaceae bacterium]
MPTIKSLEDLKKMREEALRKQELKTTTGKKEIVVGMGTVGIAAGARETLKAILEFVDSNHLENIIIRQTGNIGIDSFEPVVQVILPGEEKVTYGHVSPDVVKIIMEEHVIKGKIVADYQVKS